MSVAAIRGREPIGAGCRQGCTGEMPAVIATFVVYVTLTPFVGLIPDLEWSACGRRVDIHAARFGLCEVAPMPGLSHLAVARGWRAADSCPAISVETCRRP